MVSIIKEGEIKVETSFDKKFSFKIKEGIIKVEKNEVYIFCEEIERIPESK